MKRPTRHHLRLVNTAAAIRENPTPESQKLTFMARELVQITLPHSDPGNVPIWTRYNGDQILSIRPGVWRGELLGYPYGTVPRLLIYWMTQEALRTKSRNLYLGDSVAMFMRNLNLDPGRGGVRSDRNRLRNQALRFFRASFTNEYVKDTRVQRKTTWQDVHIAPEGTLWWSYDGHDDDDVFNGHLTLSEQAYKMFTDAPVPYDLRVISVLKNSCLALDLYNWVTYKTFLANKSGKRQRVPWRSLMKQLGSGYGNIRAITADDVRNFRRKSKKTYNVIDTLHPGLDIDYFSGGVDIGPGELLIPNAPYRL